MPFSHSPRAFFAIVCTPTLLAAALHVAGCRKSADGVPGVGEGGAGAAGAPAEGASSGAGGVLCSRTEALPISELMADDALRGHELTEDLVVYSFSQSSPDVIDPQIAELGPTVSIRTTGQWGSAGTLPEDYSTTAIEELKASGTRVILGLTASVIFEEQFATHEEFLDAVSRDVNNEPVPHDSIVPDAYRGNLASPAFRDLVVETAQTLVDVGADGIFFDEANAGYTGSEYDGDEGFDDYHEADFRQYLCDTHPEWTADSFASTFATPPNNTLDCSRCGAPFSMRRYLADNGWTPRSASGPLVEAWGQPIANRMASAPAHFTETYNTLYWADIVGRVRRYAREEHDRELFVTSNGLFPFVDFQSVGLYPWNPDGGGERGVAYVPQTASGALDGTVSLSDTFVKLREQSVALAGPVPVVLFIDWPNEMLAAYNDTFSPQERRDYFRLYGAEAYAAGLRFAWHLKTSIPGDPTATDVGMLDWFKAEAEFYREHAAFYSGAVPSPLDVTAGSSEITAMATELPDGSHVVHLINHAYDDGLLPHTDVSVEVSGLATASRATLASPDADEDVTLAVADFDGGVTFAVPELTSYAAIRLE